MASKIEFFIRNEHYNRLELSLNTTNCLSEEFIMGVYNIVSYCTNIQLDDEGKDACRKRCHDFLKMYKDIPVFSETFIRSIYSDMILGAETYWRETV